MTAIVFHQGKLMGDRKHTILTNPTTFVDGSKIFISDDKSFAYGVAGRSITPEQQVQYENIIRTLLEYMIVHGDDRKNIKEIVPKMDENIDFTTGILVTRCRQYIIQDIGKGIIRRLDGASHGTGTGGNIVVSMLRCGMLPHAAFDRIGKLDHLTGSVFDTIEAKRLRPFVIKGGN
ncbi:hypothetical protein D3C85_15700 [compost metagenome]